MGLFNKKPAHICQTSYDDVITYLRELEQVDYTKILKVVNTYREADKKVKKILNIKDDPIDTELDNLLDDIQATQLGDVNLIVREK